MLLLAQQDSIQPQSKKQGVFLGVDIFNPVLSVFTEKKGGEVSISVPFKQKWTIAGEIGYESNTFENAIWNVDASGLYARAGANWFVSQDINNPNMGYYFGGRIGFSPFNQTVNLFTIQGVDMPNVNGNLEKHAAYALWLEPLMGARVPLWKTNFYVDASARLRILLWNNNEYGMSPLIIPGFGINNNGLNFGLNWSIGYVFTF